MSERLTQHPVRQGHRWVTWIPGILHLVFAIVLGATAPRTWELPESPGTPYLRLCRALPAHGGPILHLLLTLALLWGAGKLVRALLPPKSPAATGTLAQSLGSSTLFIALTPWFQELLYPNTLLPALTALTWAQLTLLHSLSPGKHPLAALSGLLSGLTAGLSFYAGLGIVPLGIWMLTDLFRKTEQALRRIAFFTAGMVIALLPFAREIPERVREAPFAPEDWTQSLTPLFTAFGVGGLLLLLLGLLVGTLQKNRILLTLILSTGLLLKAGHIAIGSPNPLQTGAILFYPGLLCAYGIFRILKGVESGVHAVNPAKAKSITLLMLILLLVGLKIWAAVLLRQM